MLSAVKLSKWLLSKLDAYRNTDLWWNEVENETLDHRTTWFWCKTIHFQSIPLKVCCSQKTGCSTKSQFHQNHSIHFPPRSGSTIPMFYKKTVPNTKEWFCLQWSTILLRHHCDISTAHWMQAFHRSTHKFLWCSNWDNRNYHKSFFISMTFYFQRRWHSSQTLNHVAAVSLVRLDVSVKGFSDKWRFVTTEIMCWCLHKHRNSRKSALMFEVSNRLCCAVRDAIFHNEWHFYRFHNKTIFYADWRRNKDVRIIFDVVSGGKRKFVSISISTTTKSFRAWKIEWKT